MQHSVDNGYWCGSILFRTDFVDGFHDFGVMGDGCDDGWRGEALSPALRPIRTRDFVRSSQYLSTGNISSRETARPVYQIFGFDQDSISRSLNIPATWPKSEITHWTFDESHSRITICLLFGVISILNKGFSPSGRKFPSQNQNHPNIKDSSQMIACTSHITSLLVS